MSSLIVAVALASRGNAATIADVNGNGATLAGQVVTVTGTVAEPKVGYAGETTYTLTDGEQRLAIFGKGATPPTGQRLTVTGTVGYKAPDEEFTWPPVLVGASWQPTP